MSHKPHLIIGQGLAGSALAFAMEQAGLPYHIVDADHQHTASKVAAGLFNPITGSRFARTWMVDDIFPMLPAFYAAWEIWLETRFCYPQPIIRPFGSVEEQNLAMAKSAEPGYDTFIIGDELPASLNGRVIAPHGAAIFGSGGWVDVPVMLAAMRERLLALGKLSKASVALHDLAPTETGIVWQGNEYQSAIWCHGAWAAGIPEWAHIRFSPVRGEIISVKLDKPWAGELLSKGVYLVGTPGADVVRVGATYNWREPVPVTSDGGLAELTEGLNKLITEPYAVQKHEAGVRPAVADRRPILGWLPGLPNMAMLNGLGSKGTSLAPWLATLWVRHLQTGMPLPQAISPARFLGKAKA